MGRGTTLKLSFLRATRIEGRDTDALEIRDGTEVRFRPVQPSDAHRLQRLFYSLSRDTVRQRYHGTIKTLSDATAQRLAAVDYSKDVAIVALIAITAVGDSVSENFSEIADTL